ncbi:hypothetical protein U91I_01728 [alpha proteobacterium U9-1i]|nr:hypothetical protein U91I_01728 [alpha proteobacterium U9-1i]
MLWRRSSSKTKSRQIIGPRPVSERPRRETRPFRLEEEAQLRRASIQIGY